MHPYRSHTCADLNAAHAAEAVTLSPLRIPLYPSPYCSNTHVLDEEDGC